MCDAKSGLPIYEVTLTGKKDNEIITYFINNRYSISDNEYYFLLLNGF